MARLYYDTWQSFDALSWSGTLFPKTLLLHDLSSYSHKLVRGASPWRARQLPKPPTGNAVLVVGSSVFGFIACWSW